MSPSTRRTIGFVGDGTTVGTVAAVTGGDSGDADYGDRYDGNVCTRRHQHNQQHQAVEPQ